MSARRPDKAKRGEEAECTGVHEHSEPRFNAVWASADTFRTEPKQVCGWLPSRSLGAVEIHRMMGASTQKPLL
ncbi:hypothetical protein DMX06_14820 [Pseudomonas mosselii]|nr:hypothetical protein DMX06_14820 [Pseudomonas mosselii]